MRPPVAYVGGRVREHDGVDDWSAGAAAVDDQDRLAAGECAGSPSAR